MTAYGSSAIRERRSVGTRRRSSSTIRFIQCSAMLSAATIIIRSVEYTATATELSVICPRHLLLSSWLCLRGQQRRLNFWRKIKIRQRPTSRVSRIRRNSRVSQVRQNNPPRLSFKNSRRCKSPKVSSINFMTANRTISVFRLGTIRSTMTSLASNKSK